MNIPDRYFQTYIDFHKEDNDSAEADRLRDEIEIFSWDLPEVETQCIELFSLGLSWMEEPKPWRYDNVNYKIASPEVLREQIATSLANSDYLEACKDLHLLLLHPESYENGGHLSIIHSIGSAWQMMGLNFPANHIFKWWREQTKNYKR